MSLLLKDIYSETKNRFRLELVCGARGLNRLINWVYVAEDIATTDFLYGNELIITTGMGKQSSSGWLYDFVAELFQQGTCGLILNTGMYLSEDDITPEIRNFCEEHSYPLFTMPWEIHIYDITRSYYNRIFRDTQSADAVTEAVLDLISGSDPEHAISVLLRRGFSPEQGYLAYCINGKGPEQERAKLENTVRLELKVHFPGSHMCHFREDILVLLPCIDNAELNPSGTGASAGLKNAVRDLAGRISRSFPRWDIRSGLGSVSELKEFPRSFRQARSALASSFSSGEIFCAFDDLGFYKILFSVSDRNVLNDYWREKLEPVITYDKIHKSCCLETLYQYLICSGSIQKIAEAMYCHRNTVNYRVRILRETLGLHLDNVQDRFELLAAFYVRSFCDPGSENGYLLF
ncbi:MAG TPA: PucR family transcriptional regulator ligand-binding domain-containing protein [Candidatus Blautia stercoripullorum]|uniref:PucR family transcriptional regulator ligand-binding domain-containing protein n=1 Tax=Candidatus Blautia stercoripullorum TaxID=2838502 RepID=A0A9D2U3G3_9FIRM|nr:PucR family transcriptional regulator ligand-binding domain-containing protein [Candidatus Blautia stercoripullorum]